MSTKVIDKEIVSYSIKKTEELTLPAKPIIPEERPELLEGVTYKFKALEFAYYVTINDMVIDNEDGSKTYIPYEIFLNSKNVEHYHWIVCTMRIISLYFKANGDIDKLISELKETYDASGGYFKKGGGRMPSVVAELGFVLEKHTNRFKSGDKK